LEEGSPLTVGTFYPTTAVREFRLGRQHGDYLAALRYRFAPLKKLDQPWGLLLGVLLILAMVALVFLVFHQK
jgi:hypothetical protein